MAEAQNYLGEIVMLSLNRIAMLENTVTQKDNLIKQQTENITRMKKEIEDLKKPAGADK